jgi:hypothetical protein
MRANQMRLYLSAIAYVLLSGLRRLGLKATELAQAQVFDHPGEAAKDRRTGSGDRAQSVDLDGVQLSSAESLSASLDEPALLKLTSRSEAALELTSFTERVAEACLKSKTERGKNPSRSLQAAYERPLPQ